MRRFLLACALALPFGGAAAAQEPERAQARIGELTLSYDASRWRVEEADGALTIACVDEVCTGIVYDMTATPEPGRFCDKPEAYETAKALFPSAGHHATNIHPFGDLAVVLTRSFDEFRLDAPDAVFACISRDDIVYRIASRLGDGPMTSYSAGHALELLRGLSAPPARQKEFELGALTVTYGSDRWTGGAVLGCLPPTCRDIGAFLVLGAQEETADCVAETTPRQGWGDEPWQIVVEGTRATLTFHATAFWTGCRNWTPPIYLACAVHEGVTYRISSGPGAGCRTPTEIPLAAFNDLLAGIRLRD